jgi:hypothetical protein
MIFFIYQPKASEHPGVEDTTVLEFSVRGFVDSGGPSSFSGFSGIS